VWFSRTEGYKAAEDLENLLMAIVLIEILQHKLQKYEHLFDGTLGEFKM
jgi:hypothetical protein